MNYTTAFEIVGGNSALEWLSRPTYLTIGTATIMYWNGSPAAANYLPRSAQNPPLSPVLSNHMGRNMAQFFIIN
jgi:hypothetical protein